jgi:hypothetical protein
LGNLPEEVLAHEDSFPLPDGKVEEAVHDLVCEDRDRACRALAVVLSHAEVARPYLRAGHKAATGADRLFYARMLGFMGETAVVPELSAALRDAEWDEKVLQGRMAEYAHLPTPTDSLVLALGWTRAPAALPAILEKVRELDAGTTLSHHRAVALALEAIADPAAAPLLAELLRKPGMSGYVMRKLEPLPDKPMAERHREGALREIVLARALYRCGDCEGLGEAILQEYRADLRALFRRHATAVLGGASPS